VISLESASSKDHSAEVALEVSEDKSLLIEFT